MLSIQEVYEFNLDALNDGHELSDLPHIEDKDVDLNTFRLGPVTPTIPSSSRPHPLLLHNLARGDNSELPYPSMSVNGKSHSMYIVVCHTYVF